MKFIAAIILTALLAFVSGLFLDWWSIAIAAFIAAILIRQKAGSAWLSGFIGLFLLWSILAWMQDSANDSLLATKIAGLIHLSGAMPLILVTGLIGGLVAGFGAMTGSFVMAKKK